MIVNHRYGFIFLKTRKTASSSIEFALSKYSGSDDIITTLLPAEEELKREKGYREAQNYYVPFKYYTAKDWLRLALKRKQKHFSGHTLAKNARRYLGEKVWKDYFKFSFERNPYDKAISRYFYSAPSQNRPEMEAFFFKFRFRDAFQLVDLYYKWRSCYRFYGTIRKS